MRFPKDEKSSPIWGLAILLAILLPLLAVMQYHWLSQLSEWEQDRLRGLLEAGTERVCEDFDSPIATIYRTFQFLLQPDDPHTIADQLAVAYDRMSEKVTRGVAHLYAQIFWVTVAAPTGLPPESGLQTPPEMTIRRFMPAGSVLEATEWPPELTGLKDHLSQFATRPIFPPDKIPVWFDDGVLAVTIPHVIPASRNPMAGVAWVVVIPDHEFLTTVFFPALIGKYLGTDGKCDLNVAVVREGSEEMLYRSDPSLTAGDFLEYDARGQIFRLRDEMLVVVGHPLGGADKPLQTDRPAAEPAPYSKDRYQPAGDRLSPEGDWQVLVRHPSGSLEAAVSSLRRRNILIGFSILLVLGASVALLIAATRRAQKLARMQMEFIRGISHELRTPLAVISSAGENLADAVVRKPEKMRQYGLVIQREGRRLANMVERVIQYARIQSGRGGYELRPVSLPDIIEIALESYRTEIDERGVEVELEISEGLPSIVADGEALASAVRNLISNAIKYSPEGKLIWVSASQGQAAKGREIQIAVQDQGVGIGSAEQGKVFQPFYRGSTARDAQIKGSGLGLSLVREIVKAHGGRVTLTSRPGSGSRFVIHLPVTKQRV